MEQITTSTGSMSNTTTTSNLEKKRTLSVDVQAHQVRRLGISEYKQAADCLADAFANDEVARYFIDTPDMAAYPDEYKWKLHVDILRYVTAAHCYKGMVTTIGPDYDAVALWMPPGTNMDSFWTICRSGLWRLYFQLSREGKTRFYNEFLPLLHHTKHSTLGAYDNNSWYLVYLGTKPSAQGKGYGRKLIEHGTSLADAAGVPCYLESSALVNIGFYERMGFEIRRSIGLQRGEKAVELTIMVREPVLKNADGKKAQPMLVVKTVKTVKLAKK